MLQSMGSQRVGHDLTTEQQHCKGDSQPLNHQGSPPCALFLCYVKVVYNDCLHLHVVCDFLPLDTSFFRDAHGYYISLLQCFDNAANLQYLPFFQQEKNLNCLAWHSRTSSICPTYISILVSHSSPNGDLSSTVVMQPPRSWLLFIFSFLLHYLKFLPSRTYTH